MPNPGETKIVNGQTQIYGFDGKWHSQNAPLMQGGANVPWVTAPGSTQLSSLPDPSDPSYLQALLSSIFGEGGLGDLLGGGGGGFSGRPTSDELAILREQARLEAEEAERERQFQREQAALEAAAREKERVENLKLERQQLFTELWGRDPVRAVLFALGQGQANAVLPGTGSRFSELGEMEGARAKATETGQALSKLTGKNVTVGATGPESLVEGLGDVEHSARTYQQGYGSDRLLLRSAFGVGSSAGTGVAEEDVERRIQAVTPKGIL